jgi:hypothetical protein
VIPEREQWDSDRDGALRGVVRGPAAPLRAQQTFAAIAPFVVFAAKGRLGSGLTIQDAIALRRERRGRRGR